MNKAKLPLEQINGLNDKELKRRLFINFAFWEGSCNSEIKISSGSDIVTGEKLVQVSRLT